MAEQQLLSESQNVYKDMYSVTKNISICIICEVLSETDVISPPHKPPAANG